MRPVWVSLGIVALIALEIGGRALLERLFLGGGVSAGDRPPRPGRPGEGGALLPGAVALRAPEPPAIADRE